MIYMGVDCGITGAFAIVDGESVRFFDMPTIEIKSGKKKKRVLDAAEIVNILMREIGRSGNVVVAVEKASANPMSVKPDENGVFRKQGTVSMFSFGVSFGMVVGILAGLQLPYTLVHPRTWKSQLMRDQGTEKGASILRAKQLYPQAAPCLNLVKHHGRADALLLAHYARLNLSLGQVAPNIELVEVEAPLFEPAF